MSAVKRSTQHHRRNRTPSAFGAPNSESSNVKLNFCTQRLCEIQHLQDDAHNLGVSADAVIMNGKCWNGDDEGKMLE